MNDADREEGGACFYCGERATLLCDGILGWRRVFYEAPPLSHPRWSRQTVFTEGRHGWWCIDTSLGGDEMVTCDRPLCEGCAVGGGVLFICGDGLGPETIDHCRDCAAAVRAKPPLLDDETLDALARRRLLRAEPTPNRIR